MSLSAVCPTKFGFDGRDLDCVQEGQGQQGDLIGLEQMPIFNFPAGANAGNFMHDVFEHLDFSDSSNWKNTFPKNWKTISTSRKKWTSAIYEMVTEVMQTELEGFSP